MPQLVDEGGEVGFLQERDGVGCWIEGAARIVSVLVVNVGIRRVKRARVAGGRFDLRGVGDDDFIVDALFGIAGAAVHHVVGQYAVVAVFPGMVGEFFDIVQGFAVHFDFVESTAPCVVHVQGVACVDEERHGVPSVFLRECPRAGQEDARHV